MVLIVCRRHDRVCERTTAPDGTPRLACIDCLEEIGEAITHGAPPLRA